MRVTFNMMSLKYIQNLQNSLERMSLANDKVTKGRNLLSPESDVVAYASSINVQRTIDEGQQFAKNAENASGWLSNYDNELQRAFDLIRTAKNQYAIAGANASQNSVSRKALAGDVSNMLQSLVDVGNANYFGRYFFSGYKTDTKAFAADSRIVSSVKIDSVATEADIIKRGVFADMPELKKGSYKLNVSSSGEYVTISLQDSKGKKVIIDSNGSDESAKDGNYSGTELKVKYRAGEVVNLGVGVAVKLPQTNVSFNATFNFTPGDDITYQGDDGVVTTKIGYQQDVGINFTGKEVFTEVERILQGTRYNTVKGLQITETTKFSEIDGANLTSADYIDISGTDHNGLKIGTAKIRGLENVTFDMTNKTSAERTISITYAGKTQNITLAQRSYKNIDDIVFSLNRELETVGWGEEIKVIPDGDKLLFNTTRSGNGVRIIIDASLNNPFGLSENPASASGTDTTFEFGFDSYKTDPLSVSFAGVATGNQITLYVDNNYIEVSTSASTLADVASEINASLQNLGLDSLYNASVDGANLKIEKMNVNFFNNSILTVKIDDTITKQYKSSNARDNGYPFSSEKRISDLLNFIENLYDNAVEAKLNNGYLVINDKRGGESRLSIKLNPGNTGIGYPEIDQNVVLRGKYTGAFDDEWIVNVNTATNTITVTDSNGNTVKSTTIPVDYHGEEIDLGYGVNMILPDNNSHSFKLKLKSSANLSFGDMNIVQEGKNVNTFRTLKNLYEALNLDIPQEGIGAPSAWRDEKFKSTLKPYLDGTFRGNYNDQWKYEIQTKDKKTSFYLQKELTTTSISEIGSSGNADFNIVLKDKNGNITSVTFSAVPITNVVSSINSDSTLSANGVKAELVNNKLVVKSGSGLQEIELNPLNSTSANLLGFSPYNSVSSKNNLNLKLSDTTDLQRTITFNYNNGSWQTASILVDKKDYDSLDQLINEINSNPSLPAGITAANVDNRLTFNYTPAISGLLVSGDYEGTLGFLKAGDEVNVKVSNAKGELINEIKLDTSNKLRDVADGVKLSFDNGFAYATDYFTSTVGSGINYEIGILDRAENQINEKLTIAGTRMNRVESVVTFQQTVKTSSESVKARYLGSTPQDATAAITEFQIAQQAYQAALATSAKIMQLSILDYIR
ncbi:MAG: hypothetical protein LDL13_05475 [Calditerrivibrio sp.]|nr:hypothetical protein [Calditerrivibrio sp.]MCA1980077.1 hypothetical protein [Calditerrivibrio sp.]